MFLFSSLPGSKPEFFYNTSFLSFSRRDPGKQGERLSRKQFRGDAN
ncbi:hypothetical protein HMPREF0765_2654 [Sphingobacterium spiritivorum ATCC 33300]|uniref:Uncharacterized protein n=1 Tax=Sphingobacterium spiritivorum ATCC 33300 TaxID=525372 RepID=C2FZ98_SPHSI|nr:hypothetical protein HMPREF0765_2654 [Sphingobacterium spiritivorum ATCC 33300]